MRVPVPNEMQRLARSLYYKVTTVGHHRRSFDLSSSWRIGRYEINLERRGLRVYAAGQLMMVDKEWYGSRAELRALAQRARAEEEYALFLQDVYDFEQEMMDN